MDAHAPELASLFVEAREQDVDPHDLLAARTDEERDGWRLTNVGTPDVDDADEETRWAIADLAPGQRMSAPDGLSDVRRPAELVSCSAVRHERERILDAVGPAQADHVARLSAEV